MSTIVQSNYRPTIEKGQVGMIADETSNEIGTWQVETAAGIGFGLAVSKGTGDKQAVIGGASFVGISVADVTMNGIPLDPLNDGTPITVDKYGKDYNMGVMSRGHIWVRAQGNVTAGDALYYEQTGGTLANSASGAAASGKVVFSKNPVADETITINGLVVTFKASGASGDQVNIGATLNDTLNNLVAYLNAETDVKVQNLITFAAYPTGGANELHMSADVVGVTANSYVTTTTVEGATVTDMAGGTAAATAITGGFWLTSALAGELAKVSLGLQR